MHATRDTPEPRSFSRSLISLVCAILALAFVAMAQAAQGPLPQGAQEAAHKGVVAASQQDYRLAVRYFEDARKIAPQAAEIFYDLGLAESKIPGRELRAIAWLHAYLATAPRAPNAAAVKDQIEALDVKSVSNLRRLIESVQSAANGVSNPVVRMSDLIDVTGLWGRAGDITAATKVANRDDADYYYSLAEISFFQANGDIAGAQKTANLITSVFIAASAEMCIAISQARAGDIAGALRTADYVGTTLGKPHDKNFALVEIAKAQALAGDSSAALKTASLIQTVPFDPGEAAWARAHIARIQTDTGEVAAARKTVDLNMAATSRALAQAYIALAQVKKGDFPGALNTADSIQDANLGRAARHEITKALTSDEITANPASAWLQILDDDDSSKDSWCALNTELFLDPASYLRSLPSASDPQKTFEALRDTGTRMARARDAIQRMLKEQARE